MSLLLMSVALQRTMRTNCWVWKFGHKQRRIRGEFRSEVACSRQQARRYRGAGFRGRGVRVSLFRSIPCLLPTMAYGNVGCCNVREVILYGHVPSSWFDNTRIYSGSMQSPLFSIPLQHYYQEKCCCRCGFEQTDLNGSTMRPLHRITLRTIQYQIPT